MFGMYNFLVFNVYVCLGLCVVVQLQEFIKEKYLEHYSGKPQQYKQVGGSDGRDVVIIIWAWGRGVAKVEGG